MGRDARAAKGKHLIMGEVEDFSWNATFRLN